MINEQMNGTSKHGMVHLHSTYDFGETLKRLESALKEKGIHTFCRIDHSGEAAKAGLAMRPTFLVIFGSPKAGTPLMIESPTLALDLPLKVLIWEGEGKAIWLTYNSVEYLRQRHKVPSEAAALSAVEHLLTQVTGHEEKSSR